MILDLSLETEAKLAARAKELDLSVEALVEKLVDDGGLQKTSAPETKPLRLPLWNLGVRGDLHRRDIYDDGD